VIEMSRVQLELAGKTTHITGFNDPTITDSLAVIDLVDAVRKGTIDYSLVKPGHTQQVFYSVPQLFADTF